MLHELKQRERIIGASVCEYASKEKESNLRCAIQLHASISVAVSLRLSKLQTELDCRSNLSWKMIVASEITPSNDL